VPLRPSAPSAPYVDHSLPLARDWPRGVCTTIWNRSCAMPNSERDDGIQCQAQRSGHGTAHRQESNTHTRTSSRRKRSRKQQDTMHSSSCESSRMPGGKRKSRCVGSPTVGIVALATVCATCRVSALVRCVASAPCVPVSLIAIVYTFFQSPTSRSQFVPSKGSRAMWALALVDAARMVGWQPAPGRHITPSLPGRQTSHAAFLRAPRD